jgi:hypothetical protein
MLAIGIGSCSSIVLFSLEALMEKENNNMELADLSTTISP